MEPIHVLGTLRFTEGQLDKLRAVSPRLEVRQETCRNAEEVTIALHDEVEVLYTFHCPTTLDAVPRLRWVQLHSAGSDHLLDTQLWQSDVIITTTSGIHATTIGEYVIASMLAFTRRFPRMFHFQQRAEWASDRWKNFVGRELRGSTICIVGYGSIGREVARLARCLGMRVLAIKRNPENSIDTGFVMPGIGDPDGSIPEAIYPPQELRQALARSDYVVLTVPSAPSTRGLIGREELRSMTDHAYLVNISRGNVIDQQALVCALREGWIGGAGLDVFDPEPLPAESPLWQLDNIIISPHVSGFTPHYDDYATDLFAENLRRYLDGRPLLNQVDRQRGY
ncbi:MAG: D-2-hydroxyacid dehydrogenase [Deltaproteobacteria bacterium]|nr:D-2-hydroxyacid dehydrogenase [Deltaproteobacteria bacterium]MBW2307383.1 D-2-hydroxyacid dehydrogenase [Deltaproteobacteria bacterium]